MKKYLPCLLFVVLLSSCNKKEHYELITAENESPFNGTTWTTITSDHSVTAMLEEGNLFLLSFLDEAAVSGTCDGTSLTLNQQSLSNADFLKLEKVENTIFGIGRTGSDAIRTYTPTANGGTWENSMYVDANVTGIIYFINKEFIACDAPPYVRMRQGGGFVEVPVEADVNGVVRDMIKFQGEMIIAGDFTHAGSTELNHIARWHGSGWEPMDLGLVGGTVRDLLSYNGQLIAVGSFTASGSGNTSCHFVAVWNEAAGTWMPLGNGLSGNNPGDGAYKGLAFYSELVIGGSFDSPDGINSPNLVRWDGQAWKEVAGGAPGSRIHALAGYKNNLYIANDPNGPGPNFVKRLD